MSERKRRVLLVDDEPSILKIVGKQLEVAGFDVLVAQDGESGFVTARSEQPDVIILDLMMPNRSGLEVCKMLREDERCKQTPIIFYTGKGEEMSNEVLREWGAQAFLSKTRGTAALVQQIETLLQE